MGHADNPAGSGGQSRGLAGHGLQMGATDPPASAELVIIGGGIMGLWAAVHAQRLGINTLLVDAGSLGAGASGGLLGALMPHMPDKWNDKKQFQFDALVSLEDEIAKIEGATGLSCGYRRSGRLIPLPKPHLRDIALRHSADAKLHWHRAGRREAEQFGWHVTDRPATEGWPDMSFAAAGLVYDSFAARVSPRALIMALATFLRQASRIRIIEGMEVAQIDPARGRVVFSTGESTAFGRCIVAAGHQSFPLLQALSPMPGRPLGQPVKGQAALLKADVDPALPVIFLNGLYVVAHENGQVAIGSTSEENFEHAEATDSRLDQLIERARVLVPALKDAPVTERWAGLRPKAIDRDPMVGPHPDHAQVIALTGGFKVSFGLAHALAAAALGAPKSPETGLPGSFTLENHLAAASR